MLTVSHYAPTVESDLATGRLCCPDCQDRLQPWGFGAERRIRHGIGVDQQIRTHRPRRARCSGCQRTHVLLDIELASRRADTAAVIAAALESKATTGAGHRTIAALLGRPLSTVRGWLRSFTTSAARIAETFTLLIHRHGADPAGLWPAPASTPAGQAVAAVTAYAQVLTQRFAIATLTWQSAGLAMAGPGFFSAGRWPGDVQHELALMPMLPGGKAGQSTGPKVAGATIVP